MKTIRFKHKDSHGNVWETIMPGVASWADETSPHDPYTLRVMRNALGKSLGGPMLGEFFDWTEEHEPEGGAQ